MQSRKEIADKIAALAKESFDNEFPHIAIVLYGLAGAMLIGQEEKIAAKVASMIADDLLPSCNQSITNESAIKN